MRRYLSRPLMVASKSPLALLADRQGSVAIFFALAAVPMLLAAGGALDYTHAIAVKSRLQQSLDNGIIAAAAKGTTDVGVVATFLNTQASGGADAVTLTISMKNAPGGGSVYVGDATVPVRTHFLQMVGIKSIPVGAHSEADAPARIVSVTFKPIHAQGAYSKDIFIWTKDASGAITWKQTALIYRYGVAGSGTTPSIGNWTTTFSVPKYSTYGVGMVVYEDWQNYSGALINPVTKYSDVNPASFIQQKGSCTDPNGAKYNMEDGGDTNFLDFVYNFKCTMSASNATAHLTK
jgi:hypothetical protein